MIQLQHNQALPDEQVHRGFATEAQQADPIATCDGTGEMSARKKA
jgi:hypothetical protein